MPSGRSPFNELCKQGPEGVTLLPDSGGLQHPSIMQLWVERGEWEMEKVIWEWNTLARGTELNVMVSKSYLGAHIFILKVVRSLKKKMKN